MSTLTTLLLAVAVAAPGGAAEPRVTDQSRSVVGSKHDFSAQSGRGEARAVSETQVCVFCHGSHGTDASGSNRPDPSTAVETYRSASMASKTAGGPGGVSRQCLSCHDGTVAIGETRRGRIQMTGKAPGGLVPAGKSRLGTDLRGSHPVSIPLATSGRLRRPQAGEPVRLDKQGQVQCTSCHDPHREAGDSGEGKFLVRGTRRGDLCLACHATSEYQGAGAAHTASAGGSPGAATLADQACSACHLSHGGDGRGRLIRRAAGEDDDVACLRCHDGKSAKADLVRELAKPYAHALAGPHDAAEGPTSPTHRLPEASPGTARHAGCADCHDPHLATGRLTEAPMAGGALAGTWGVDLSGNRVAEARFEYEVCFKCHADSANQPQARGTAAGGTVRRAIPEVNLRRVFDATAASAHPVAAARAGSSPSLKAPLKPGAMIRCSDCHANDTGPGAGGAGPRGPHGSTFPHLLERGYLTADNTPESAGAYALCYKCHDRQVLLSAASSFPLHARHLTVARATCAACHDPHGVSAAAGTPANNAHLVDFDVSVVKPNQAGLRRYTSQGPGAGSCALSCHGVEHTDRTYPAATPLMQRRHSP